MQSTTRTIYGSKFQTNLLLGLPHEVDPFTTLNERFDVFPNQSVPQGSRPSMMYYCIGYGGHRNQVGADNTPYTAAIKHSPADAGLFKPLPFVLREVDNDLSGQERQKYAIRRRETIGGTDYFAYYLKRIDLSGVSPQMTRTTVSGGVSSTTEFTPDSSNLEPTPAEIPAQGAVTTLGDYLSVTATVEILFDAADVNELINVANIKFENDNLAIISEIGLVAGIDQTVTGENAEGSNTVSYEEALRAQVINHVTAYYAVGFTQRGFDFRVELGATEPLLGPSQVTVDPTP